MTEINVREIAPGDRETYEKMAAEFYSSPAVMHNIPGKYIKDTFDELISGSGYAKALIAEKDGCAVGYALLALTWSQEAGGRVAWIDEIYVRPAARGLGAGSRLIEETARRFPSARFRLEVEPDNAAARRLYERLGYRTLPYMQMYKGN